MRAWGAESAPATFPHAAQAKGHGGIAHDTHFIRSAGAIAEHESVVKVSVAKVDSAWREHNSLTYLMRGGIQTGGGSRTVEDRYPKFGAFLKQSNAAGNPVQMSRMHLHKNDAPSFADGRHRFAYLRDHGATSVPVSVPRSQAAEVRRRFGAS